MSILGIQSRILGLVRSGAGAIQTHNLPINKLQNFLPQEGIHTPPLQRLLSQNFEGKHVNLIDSKGDLPATRAFSTTLLQQKSSGDMRDSMDFMIERKRALKTLWPAIQSQLKFDLEEGSVPSTGEQIHRYLHNLANVHKIRSIDKLECSDFGLTTLPSEIGLFTGLKNLVLNNNQLARLPLEICKLTKLQELYLSNNQLTRLPYDIAACTQLGVLDLSHNRLQSLPYGIAYLRNLASLDLSHNQLTSVHYLLSNTDFNPYREIPICLDHNPLIAFLDHHLCELANEKPLSSFEIARRSRICAEYSPQSPIAKLAQAINYGAEDGVLYNRFKDLSDEKQRHITTEWTLFRKANSRDEPVSSFSQESLLADRAMFTRAVIAVMREKLSVLSTAQKDQLYYCHMWELAGGSRVSSKSPLDHNPILLIDALEKVV